MTTTTTMTLNAVFAHLRRANLPLFVLLSLFVLCLSLAPLAQATPLQTHSYTYDADHRLTTLSDNAGDQITYTLDAMGNHLSETLTGSASIASLHKKIDQGLAHARLFATR